jgi:hypothetical protein
MFRPSFFIALFLLGSCVHTTVRSRRSAPSKKRCLTQEQILATLGTTKGRLKACYDKQRSLDTSLCGVVKTRFWIHENGKVLSTQIISDNVNNAEIKQCIIEALNQLTFPRCDSGTKAEVTYPFKFMPSKGCSRAQAVR